MAGVAFVASLATVYSFSGGREVYPLAALGFDGLTAFDLIREGVSNFILPLSGLAYCLIIGWALRREDVCAALPMADGRLFTLWYTVVRIIAPLAITALFIGAVFG